MQGLISNLIRPFRFRYSPFDLGSKVTESYSRDDSTLLNDRNLRIQYSYYRNKKHPSQTCLVYAHCNSGCRIEGLQFVQATMEQGWNLCLFDFAGSGISEGEFVSLGYFEWMDLQAVISMVLGQGNNRVHLWGRSMGAATIILYLSETKQIDNIVSCVLDSPYSSLWRVIRQFGKSKTKIPQFIVQHVMQYLRNSIFKDHRFDIKSLDLLKKIHNIELPIMFIASTSDSFVNCSHAAELYKWAPSKQKVLEYIEKEHNSPRETNTIRTGLAFMAKSLLDKEQSRRELRILSKKKELCRKMTGHNMAELITKPAKDPVGKNQVHSTGNLGRFNSFCFNNLATTGKKNNQQGPIESNENSPKPDNERQGERKEKQKAVSGKNPHKIQQSIIKLALPPKEMLQRMRRPESGEGQSHRFEMNATTNIKIGENNQDKLDPEHKENNLNVSNKSKGREDQSGNKLNSKIKNFDSIITKRFHFDLQDQNVSQVDLQKLKPKDTKSRTQKINIHIKNPALESPTKKNKPTGIKLFNKIKPEKEKNPMHPQPVPNKKGKKSTKSRVKTEMVHGLSSSSSGRSSQRRLKTNDLYSSYQDISIEEKEPEEKRWLCGAGASLCKMGKIDCQQREVYMNKYRDCDKARDSQDKHKISCNQDWISRQSDFNNDPVKFEARHFHSIGDLPTSDNDKEVVKVNSNALLGTQKIIKIQLDRNLFQAGKKKEESNVTREEKKNAGQASEQEAGQKSRHPSINLPNPVLQMNPILSKFKLKHKRPINRDRKVQNTSII